MNKDTKIDIEDIFDIDAVIGLRNEIARNTGAAVNPKDSLYIVSNKYIEEKEEFRRIMKELLTCCYLESKRIPNMAEFIDGMRLLGLKEEDFY